MSQREPDSPNDDHDAVTLPSSARGVLDEIARALNITTTLLSGQVEAGSPDGSGTLAWAEASSLLQAFISISDAETRRRCLDFVREEAAREQVRG